MSDGIDGLRRIVHGNWFIQSRETRRGMPESCSYMAWASLERTTAPLDESKGDIYFAFGRDEAEAVSRVIAEVDALPEGS